MKEKIAEVQEYFKEKMLNGQFEVLEITQYVVKIRIDELYQFSIWVANWSENLKFYTGAYNFMQFNFEEKEKYQLWIILSKIIDDYNKIEGLRIKREQFNKLSAELGEELLKQDNF